MPWLALSPMPQDSVRSLAGRLARRFEGLRGRHVRSFAYHQSGSRRPSARRRVGDLPLPRGLLALAGRGPGSEHRLVRLKKNGARGRFLNQSRHRSITPRKTALARSQGGFSPGRASLRVFSFHTRHCAALFSPRASSHGGGACAPTSRRPSCSRLLDSRISSCSLMK